MFPRLPLSIGDMGVKQYERPTSPMGQGLGSGDGPSGGGERRAHGTGGEEVGVSDSIEAMFHMASVPRYGYRPISAIGW